MFGITHKNININNNKERETAIGMIGTFEIVFTLVVIKNFIELKAASES